MLYKMPSALEGARVSELEAQQAESRHRLAALRAKLAELDA